MVMSAGYVRANLRFISALSQHLRYNFVSPIDGQWEGPARSAIEAVARGNGELVVKDGKTANEIVDDLRLDSLIPLLPAPIGSKEITDEGMDHPT